MATYNGYEVYPGQLRTRAAGYTTCGETVEAVKKTLQDRLGDGAYIGGDDYAAAFLQRYRPLLESVWTLLDRNARGLHEVRGGLDFMAATYEQANSASTLGA